MMRDKNQRRIVHSSNLVLNDAAIIDRSLDVNWYGGR